LKIQPSNNTGQNKFRKAVSWLGRNAYKAGAAIMSSGANALKAESIFDFTAKDIDGNEISLEKYRGHVCVIVNVASK